MSKVSITGNASGTGTFTLAAPNSNTDRTLTLPDEAGTVLTSASDIGASQLPAGSVLQVVSTPKTDVFSTSSTSFVDVTGLSASITPNSASSKILIMIDVKLGSDSNVSGFLKLLRGSTDIYIGDAASSSQRVFYGNGDDPSSEWPYQASAIFLDSPSTTSSTTYKVQLLSEPYENTGTVYINRSGQSGTSGASGRTASSITLMEIAG